MLTLFLLGCLAIAQCAPTEQAAEEPPSSPGKLSSMKAIDTKQLQPPRKYLFLDPEAQRQFQSAVENPMFQPLVLLGSTKMRGKLQQLCDRMQGGIDGLPDSFLGNLFVIGDPEDDDGEFYDDELSAKQRVPEINTEAETIPDSIIPQGKAPQTPTVVREHRFYTIAGPPQFFGNVDILQDPYHPIFSIQPLQAIRIKSTAASMNDTRSHTSKTEIPLINDDITQKEPTATQTAGTLNETEKENKTTKTNTKKSEWDSSETAFGKSVESVESTESTEMESKNMAESLANRLDVNWMQQQTVTATAEKGRN